MKKNLIMLMAVVGVALSISVRANEGHDHDHGHDHGAPGGLEARKGGEIKALENVNVEVLAKGKDLKIYFFTKDNKVHELKDFKIEAFTEVPRSKQKRQPLKLTKTEDHFSAHFEAKGAHRYSLIVEVTDPAEGHADLLTFTIEPKK